MKKAIFSFSALVALVAAVAFAADVKLDGVKCPVSGAPVKADKTVDYKGGKVYFCCENCPKGFDAAKHGTKANYQLAQTGQAKQKACPISGEAVDAAQVAKVGAVEVKFCCGNCQGKVSKASPEEAMKLVFASEAFDKGFEVPKNEKK